VADEIYTNLTGALDGQAHPDSVHLSDWPVVNKAHLDDNLRERMGLVRRLVTLGRSARTDAKVRTRQPLARALIVLPAAQADALGELESVVAEELNVKELEHAGGVAELVSYTVKPNFKALGPRFGARVKSVAQGVTASDPAELVRAIERDGAAHLDVEGEQVSLGPDDLDIRVEGREGFSLVQDGPYGVALDLDITPELLAEGIAREVVRAVQELRKTSGLAVEDRIELWLSTGDDRTRAALAAHVDAIAGEVLATETTLEQEPPAEATAHEVTVESSQVSVALRQVG
jgi:isoleucyl-tRNA synthetase